MPPRRNRVTRGEDYRRTIRTGTRVGGATCITHALLRAPSEPARFGFIVAKTVGNAVMRNRVRRRLKTVVERHLHGGLVGVDVVIRALPSAADASYVDLERQVDRAIERLTRVATGEGETA